MLRRAASSLYDINCNNAAITKITTSATILIAIMPKKHVSSPVTKVISSSASSSSRFSSTAAAAAAAAAAGRSVPREQASEATEQPNRRARRPIKPQLTHFISIPLSEGDIRVALDASIDRFRNEAAEQLSELSSSSFWQQSVRSASTLHLTLGVMSLSAEQLECAIKLLSEIDLSSSSSSSPSQQQQAGREMNEESRTGGLEDILQKQASTDRITQDERTIRPIRVRLVGLESMHDPRSTTVLYVQPVDSSGRLRVIAGRIRKAFLEKGLLQFENRELILHATVLNSVYAKPSQTSPSSSSSSSSSPAGKKKSGPRRLDARGLLERFAGFDWLSSSFLSPSFPNSSSDSHLLASATSPQHPSFTLSTTTTVAAAGTACSQETGPIGTSDNSAPQEVRSVAVEKRQGAAEEMVLEKVTICKMGVRQVPTQIKDKQAAIGAVEQLFYEEVAERSLLSLPLTL